MGNTTENSRLHTQYFADDQVVIVEGSDYLSYMIRKFDEYYKQVGLTIICKNQYLVLQDNTTEDLQLKTGNKRCE